MQTSIFVTFFRLFYALFFFLHLLQSCFYRACILHVYTECLITRGICESFAACIYHSYDAPHRIHLMQSHNTYISCESSQELPSAKMRQC